MSNPAGQNSNRVWFNYKLWFDDDSLLEFIVELDAETLALIPPPGASAPPAWAALDFHRCPNCPLDQARFSHCPVAVNIAELIELTKDLVSHTEVNVVVETRERKYVKRTPLQAVISSLLGIYMVTSGCPRLDKLRPMVETHLPFSSAEETMYRAISMYLTAQYFLHKNHKPAGWDLRGLADIYREIEIVNTAFTARLNGIKTLDKDASLNAVNILNCFATLTSLSIEEDCLGHWERIFLAHYG